MPGNRVISHLGRPRHVPAAPSAVSAAHHVGHARVRVHGHHHHNYHIYHWGGHYWGHHHDHFDYWYGHHGYWWCPHHHVYLDWGYPPVFVKRIYVESPEPPSKGPVTINHGQNLYFNEGVFHFWDGSKWRLIKEDQLLKLGSNLYLSHQGADEEAHYDRFIEEAGQFYCSEHGTYYNAFFFSTPDHEWVENYGLWWSESEQMYHTYIHLNSY